MSINEIVFLIGYWGVYFFLHSLLASNGVKNLFINTIPSLNNYYRILYNIISLLGLIFILGYLAITPSSYVINKSEYLQFIGLVLATWGLIVLKLSFKQYSIREFLGLNKLNGTEHSEFASQGILSKVRHPIYSGTILVVSGFFLFNPKLSMGITLGCVVLYILIGIQLEEKKLTKEYGQLYLDYKEKVPMLIPRLIT